MADGFSEQVLRSSIALMCIKQGWNQASNNGLKLFSNVVHQYFRNIGILALKYSLHAGRYEPSLEDIALTFQHLGISLSDLQQFWAETEPGRGAIQLPRFPVHIPDALKIPDVGESDNPDYIPDYLPSLNTATKPPVVEEKTIQEETTVIAEQNQEVNLSKSASDAFDEAAAAPLGPSFPFFNKTEHQEPKVSSWGFQRITINAATPSLSADLPGKSPDNELFNENSDDFVFASKLSKSKEDNKIKSQQNALKSDVNGNVNNENLPKNDNSVKNNHQNGQLGDATLEFQPLLATSTPLLDKNVDSYPTILNSNIKATTTVIEEEMSGFAPSAKNIKEANKAHKDKVDTSKLSKEKKETSKTSKDKKDILKIPKDKKDASKACKDKKDVPKIPKDNKDSSKQLQNKKEICTPIIPAISNGTKEEHEPFDLNFNSSDFILKVSNHMSPVSPASPVRDLSKEMRYTPPVTPVTPPNKRRKLEKPSLSPKNNSVLLKDRPDLIHDYDVKKVPKSGCKLTKNHQNNSVTPIKIKKVTKPDNIKLTLKNNSIEKAKKHKTSEIHIHNEENCKKVKKKKHRAKTESKDDAINKLIPDSLLTKVSDKYISESVSEAKPLVSLLNYVEPINNRISPISISLNKTVDKTQASLNSSSKYEIKTNSKSESARKKATDSKKINSVPPLKLTVKTPSASKIKSKSFIDSDDDCSSLSSDSLDGFESLIPKKITNESSNDTKKMFKTKAELKNPCPSLSLVTTISAVTDKKKTKQSSTTKIKIAKTSPLNAAGACISKPSMKLKFPIPKSEPVSPITSLNSKVKSEPSLEDDGNFSLFNSSSIKGETSQPKSVLKVPKIKIKIASSHLSDTNAPQEVPQETKKAQTPKAAQDSVNSIEKTIKPLKLKLSEPQIPPVAPKSPKTVKKKVVKQKAVKPARETKELKQKPAKIKIKTVVKEPKLLIKSPLRPSLVSPLNDKSDHLNEALESTVISETVESVTIASTTEPSSGAIASSAILPEKIWYCPSCMLPDDGSPMVGCDTCDEWYHWPCVGLVQAPPDNLDWFCPPCTKKRKTVKKRGGNRKKRKT